MNTTARIAIFTASLAVAGLAQAQYQKPMGLSIRAGLFFPSNGVAKDTEGQSWFAVGAQYKIRDLKFDTASSYSATLDLSIDYYGKGSFTNTPMMLNYVGRSQQIYYSAGAGIGFTHVPRPLGGSASDEDFVYGFTVGYDFVRGGTPLFVEAKYFGSNEAQLNGFAIMGGIRF